MLGLIIAGIGVAVSVFGAAQSMSAASQQSAAQGQATAAQQQAERIRKQALETDVYRRRREFIRMNLIARAQSLTTATAQGAGSSSALEGARATSTGELAFGLQGLNAQQKLGVSIFQSNSSLLDARYNIAQAESSAMTARSLSGLGSTLLNNVGSISRVGSDFMNSTASDTTSGLSSYGGFVRGISGGTGLI